MKWVVYRTNTGHVDVARANEWDEWLATAVDWTPELEQLRDQEICRVEKMSDALNLRRLANEGESE